MAAPAWSSHISLAVAKGIIAADHGTRTRAEVLELATRRLLD
ncbi:hypothetical protein OU415_14510 [Saccharopolyspora sp. WRP15-2]|uniref:TetR family transcriptional regulator n=1 Tax=Saccharopolyspora oryzae TaxID=2997343 RepID=A0ABT4UY66_9PSEU|nr:hypothetical protein [Saccharopolyspora oryzae]MDA3626655.1 hypothetical protein [Saccharopolyspora oryzae]